MKKYIPNIHDYCDRWCDKCKFKPRCAFIQGKLDMSKHEDSVKMLAWESKQYGLQTDITVMEMMTIEKFDKIENEVEADELVIAATEFRDVMRLLLEDFTYWTQMAVEHAKQTASGIRDGNDVLAEVRMIDKCRDLLCWDFIFIGAKIRRAVAGQLIDDNALVQSDSNGSAKVAMISIDRAYESLKKIFELKPDEDRFLKPLALITKIQCLANEKFPHATAFMRPGFDEVILTVA